MLVEPRILKSSSQLHLTWFSGLAVESFTKKMIDNSTQAGFQFTFYCDICQRAYQSHFIQSKSARKAGFLHGLEEIANIGANLGAYTDPRLAQVLRTGADQMMHSQQQSGTMSAAWHQEHDAAVTTATNEARSVFSQCPTCKRWVCKNDWNSNLHLCVQDAQAGKNNNVPQPASTTSSIPSANTSPSTQQKNTASTTDASTSPSVKQTNSAEDPLSLLKLRLARGEITVDEFERLKHVLNET